MSITRHNFIFLIASTWRTKTELKTYLNCYYWILKERNLTIRRIKNESKDIPLSYIENNDQRPSYLEFEKEHTHISVSNDSQIYKDLPISPLSTNLGTLKNDNLNQNEIKLWKDEKYESQLLPLEIEKKSIQHSSSSTQFLNLNNNYCNESKETPQVFNLDNYHHFFTLKESTAFQHKSDIDDNGYFTSSSFKEVVENLKKERDNAFIERDIAMRQRDSAILARNSALQAITDTLQLNSTVNSTENSTNSVCAPSTVDNPHFSQVFPPHHQDESQIYSTVQKLMKHAITISTSATSQPTLKHNH